MAEQCLAEAQEVLYWRVVLYWRATRTIINVLVSILFFFLFLHYFPSLLKIPVKFDADVFYFLRV